MEGTITAEQVKGERSPFGALRIQSSAPNKLGGNGGGGHWAAEVQVHRQRVQQQVSRGERYETPGIGNAAPRQAGTARDDAAPNRENAGLLQL